MNRSNILCTFCSDKIKFGIITICLHIYCEGCFNNYWAKSKKKGQIEITDRKTIRYYVNCV
jgi:hypothetical protein